MKNIIVKPTLLVAFILISNTTFAQKLQKTVDECESNYQDESALSMCFDRVKEAKERELQTWINNQIFILEEFALKTGRRSALEMFKRSQRNFITFRENNCRWQYLHLSPDKSAAPAYKKCYIQITEQRIKELGNITN